MKSLQQEAEEYSKIFSLEGGHRSYAGQGFIDGANSKYVKAQIIQAKIDGLSLASENALGITYRMQELEEQLKLIEDEKAN